MKEIKKEINAVIIDKKDDVATVTKDLKKGEKAKYLLSENDINEITLLDDIPFGHKFAIRDIPKNQDVLKYGESIGKATRDIIKGEHVHIQNVESNRGRGDRK
jgi:hydrolase, uxaA family protein